MPWREINPMDGQYHFAQPRERTATMTELCTPTCMSRSIGDNWPERSLARGVRGVAERSRAPLASPNRPPHRRPSTRERGERVDAALERVGRMHRECHYPAQPSGGQQQRVAVARAVAGKPAVLLADEPTGNLESENGESVMALLSKLHRNGATICLVTHDTRYAAHAERTVQMLDGRVVQRAPWESWLPRRPLRLAGGGYWAISAASGIRVAMVLPPGGQESLGMPHDD
jgi:ABC-type dipeptide/oligopeptide/nickel transport system ATPase component